MTRNKENYTGARVPSLAGSCAVAGPAALWLLSVQFALYGSSMLARAAIRAQQGASIPQSVNYMAQENSSSSITRAVDETLGRVRRRMDRSPLEQRAEFAEVTKDKRIIVAEGDSWFAFPANNVLEDLEDLFTYDVRSAAHRGDTMESMAYLDRQHDQLARCLLRIAQEDNSPRAILISGGGNDFAGDGLRMMLNHYKSDSARRDIVDPIILHRLIHVRAKESFVRLITHINRFCANIFGRRVPILIHGYSYPVPDGRKPGPWFLGPWMPGPWLAPAFEDKGYTDLARNTNTMRAIVTSFNEMLRSLHGGSGELTHVLYVDVLDCLTSDLAQYQEDWNDELHPTETAFERVAQRFHQQLDGLPTA